MEVRVLQPGDEPRVEEFLLARLSSSMIPLSNLRAAGLVDRGEQFQGTWAGAFEDGGALVGVACHSWLGTLLLQAPQGLLAVCRAAVAASGRKLTGALGPWEQVQAAQPLFEGRTLVTRDEPEVLYELRAPRLPASVPGFRPATAADEDLLTKWRMLYVLETLLAAPDAPDLEQRTRAEVRGWTQDGRLFVLEQDGVLVACTGYNAVVGEAVQIGGVFTPPGQRGRGYARRVVAGQLLRARSEGVPLALLFTRESNAAARRVYESLGFQRCGEYGLALYK